MAGAPLSFLRDAAKALRGLRQLCVESSRGGEEVVKLAAYRRAVVVEAELDSLLEEAEAAATPRCGLFYERKDGVRIELDAPEIWLFELRDGETTIQRCVEGQIIETYAPVFSEKAAIHAVAITQGFEPPRALRRLDTPPPQTRSEPAQDRAF